jgi:septum formation protein
MLILASQSQIRQQLLAAAGVHFVAEPSPLDEGNYQVQLNALPAATLAVKLAEAKALKLSELRGDAVVIGVDQTLEFSSTVCHKATSLSEAKQKLAAMRGKTHSLHSAFSITQNQSVLSQHIEHAEITFRNFSDTFLDDYILHHSADILTSVGCYHLEGFGIQLIERYEGDYFSILGLPLLPLLQHLRHLKVLPQ